MTNPLSLVATAARPHRHANGAFVGIAAMTAAMMCFNIGDTLFKVMGSTMPVGEMLFVRGIFACLIVFAFCAYTGVLPQAPRMFTPVIGARLVMEGLCSVLFFVGLMRMSYADAAAIGQFTPLIVMAGAALFLGEAVGWRRWSAALVGFLGVLLIIKPGTTAFQPVALIVLLSMICVAARDLLTRLVPKDMPTSLLAAGPAVTGLLVGPLMAPFEQAWHWPSVSDVFVMALCAVTVMGAYVFIIIAMRVGSTAVSSQFRYTYMLFATLSSLIIFRERPDLWSWLGIGLIISAGLYMLHRERNAVRQATSGPVAKP